MNIKMLAIDLDGTLLNDSGQVSPRDLAALRDAAGQGATVLICTARRYRSTEPLMRHMGLDCEVVLHNGVLVKKAADHSTVYGKYISRDLWDRLTDLSSQLGFNSLIYTDTYETGVDFFVPPSACDDPDYSGYLDYNRENWRPFDTRSMPVDKVLEMILLGDESRLGVVQTRLEEACGPAVGCLLTPDVKYGTGKGFLEVHEPIVPKWEAILFCAAKYGIRPSQIAALGDQRNDIPMIAEAGVGIAMGNASDEVKSAADMVTLSNTECGVAEALAKLGF